MSKIRSRILCIQESLGVSSEQFFYIGVDALVILK